MKLKHVNTGLFVATLAVCAYIIVAPFMPAALFWFEAHTTDRLRQLSADLHLPAGNIQATPSDNRLVIPSMLLNTPINEGSTLAALRTGPWRRPNGSTPDKGGNTVIAGHRFTYTNPRGIFYYLDKIHVGDEIGIFWQGKRYVYKVTSTETVPPTDVAIEAPTKNAQLTLYTCTPLWLPKNRLVVIAQLEKSS
ncbi:MAG TPA: class E sortase [Patescibacteria group bacterium]|nr:class E sortase [Patescibacteria group bacterium]